MEAVREAAVGSPGGRHETITLQAETRTPRGRTLSASFVRERTPLGELPPARRQRYVFRRTACGMWHDMTHE